jgi:hypothetical protein
VENLISIDGAKNEEAQDGLEAGGFLLLEGGR